MACVLGGTGMASWLQLCVSILPVAFTSCTFCCKKVSRNLRSAAFHSGDCEPVLKTDRQNCLSEEVN